MTRPGSPARAAWMASLGALERKGWPDQRRQQHAARRDVLEQGGQSLGGIARAVDRAGQHLLAVRELAPGRGRGARPRAACRRAWRARRAGRSPARRRPSRASRPPRARSRRRPGASAASSSVRSPGSQSCVAPTARASARRAGSGSTATMARRAAQARALHAELADAAGADHDDDVALRRPRARRRCPSAPRSRAARPRLRGSSCVSLSTPLAGITTRSARAPTAVMR